MKGQYGPYIKYKSLNATIPEEKDPTELTMKEALNLFKFRTRMENFSDNFGGKEVCCPLCEQLDNSSSNQYFDSQLHFMTCQVIINEVPKISSIQDNVYSTNSVNTSTIKTLIEALESDYRKSLLPTKQ